MTNNTDCQPNMGSEDTGWCHGSGIVGEFVARGSTAKEALIGLVNKLGELNETKT